MNPLLLGAGAVGATMLGNRIVNGEWFPSGRTNNQEVDEAINDLTKERMQKAAIAMKHVIDSGNPEAIKLMPEELKKRGYSDEEIKMLMLMAERGMDNKMKEFRE